jgi:hypothetical protein
MRKPNSHTRQRLLLKRGLRPSAGEVTDEEIAYFRDYPNEIEEYAAPLSIHKYFLWSGVLLGSICVAVSKVLKFSTLLALMPEAVREFMIDIVFEAGVALIGAAVTAYLLGILLNRQQELAAKWKIDIRQRIEELNISK